MLFNKAVFTTHRRHVVGFVLASPLTALMIWWALGWSWGSSNAPAWVQAVGSIAAILASVWIANSKDERDEKRRLFEDDKAQEKARVRLSIIGESVKDIHDFSVRLLKSCCGLGVFVYHVDLDQVIRSLENYCEQLNKIDVLELPNEVVARAFLSVWGNVREAQEEIRIAAAQRKSEDYRPAVDTACKRILEATHYWFDTVGSYTAKAPIASRYADECVKELQQAYLRMGELKKEECCPLRK
ncbi:hypothetical protein [Pseudomonas sp. Marseille-QA0332]